MWGKVNTMRRKSQFVTSDGNPFTRVCSQKRSLDLDGGLFFYKRFVYLHACVLICWRKITLHNEPICCGVRIFQWSAHAQTKWLFHFSIVASTFFWKKNMKWFNDETRKCVVVQIWNRKPDIVVQRLCRRISKSKYCARLLTLQFIVCPVIGKKLLVTTYRLRVTNHVRITYRWTRPKEASPYQ